MRRYGAQRRVVAVAWGALFGAGALFQVGSAWAGPLVSTGAFRWAKSPLVRTMRAQDNGTVLGKTVSYMDPVARVVVIVSQPEFPFPQFKVDHVTNPTLEFLAGATVKFTFINRVMGFSHSFEITKTPPPYPMFPKVQPPLAGTALSPPPKSDESAYAQFTWHPAAGHYYYICAIPGHAEMGMYGEIIVK